MLDLEGGRWGSRHRVSHKADLGLRPVSHPSWALKISKASLITRFKESLSSEPAVQRLQPQLLTARLTAV